MGNYTAGSGERLPILERLYNGRGKEILPLQVNGVDFPMHTEYLFEKQKTYTVTPERGFTGQISSFPEKFFVPYFTVTYNILPIEEYSRMMRALAVDEVTVRYYDTWENKYSVAKFYAQQPEMTKMQPMVFKKNDGTGNEVKYGFIQNTTIVFAGTLNEISEIAIEFFANGEDVVGTAPARLTGYEGEEFEMPDKGSMIRNGYKFLGWADENGVEYVSGRVYAFGATPLKMFARWEATTTYTLALSYGFDTQFIRTDKDATASDGAVTVPTSISVTYDQNISGLPNSVDVLTIDKDNNYTILVGNDNNKVYTFIGWNKLQSGNGSKLENGSKYDIKGSSIANAIFSVREYTLNFYKEEANIATDTKWATVTGEYGSSFSVNEPKITGFIRTGWYVKEKKLDINGEVVKDDQGNDVYEDVRFRVSKIPAGNYNVFSKWEKDE